MLELNLKRCLDRLGTGSLRAERPARTVVRAGIQPDQGTASSWCDWPQDVCPGDWVGRLYGKHVL